MLTRARGPSITSSQSILRSRIGESDFAHRAIDYGYADLDDVDQTPRDGRSRPRSGTADIQSPQASGFAALCRRLRRVISEIRTHGYAGTNRY